MPAAQGMAILSKLHLYLQDSDTQRDPPHWSQWGCPQRNPSYSLGSGVRGRKKKGDKYQAGCM